jgi:putative ABC transport system permease protein
MITAMVILSGILGFAIVYSATVISIGERKTELSSLRVMGFYKDEIFGMILAETVLISAAGFAAGVPLGRMMTAYSEKAFSTDMYTLYMAPTPSAVFYSAVLTLLFLAAAGIATYGRIRRLDFLQALKDRIS